MSNLILYMKDNFVSFLYNNKGTNQTVQAYLKLKCLHDLIVSMAAINW